MKRMRRAILAGVILAVAFVGLGCGRTSPDRGPIQIGAILPLTGNAAQWGTPARDGAQLAVDEINAAGGVKGRQVAVTFEDDRCEPKDGVSAFNKLLAAQQARVILGAVCSSVTLAVAPLAERSHVVLISPASTNPKITAAGDFIFRVIPSDNLRGEVFADYLYQDRGLRSVAALYINNEGGVGNRDAFRSRFTQLGGRIETEEAYAQDATDVRSQLTKLKSSSAEALLVVSYPRDTILVMKQARDLDVRKPLFFQTEAVEDPSVLREAGAAAEGATYILPASAAGDAPQRFIQAYQKKYNRKPELFAAEAYDAIRLVVAALQADQTGSGSPGAVRDFLYKARNWPGASGTITFDQSGDVSKPMAIKQIVKGESQLLIQK